MEGDERKEVTDPYDDFRSNQSRVSPIVCLHDQNGKILYEDDDLGLRDQIIRLNDTALLEQYISQAPRAVTSPADVYYHDPFFIAAECGSTDVLRMLLNVQKTNPTQRKAPDIQMLLETACQKAHINVVRFLLDSEPLLANVRARTECGDTALLSAAYSLEHFSYGDWKDNDLSEEWIRDRFARSEELIQLLLDRGLLLSQPRNTVLGLAVSRASPGLVEQLIDEGADVCRKDWYLRQNDSRFRESYIDATDVSVLHLASSYWNVAAIKVLLQNGGSELLSSSDSTGRLPIHWAAAGPNFYDEHTIPDHELESRIIETFELLLNGDLEMINVKDKEGKTALFHTIRSHAGCGISHLYLLTKFLLEKGANAGLQNNKGQNVLHIMAANSTTSEPIDAALVDLLIAHGVDIHQTDMNGDTTLHLTAKNLRQVEMARALVSKGANVRAVNAQRKYTIS